MSNPASPEGTQTSAVPPWRIVIHDPDPDDPKILLATVTDVDTAWPRMNAASLADAARWAASHVGLRIVALVPVPGATAWAVVKQP